MLWALACQNHEEFRSAITRGVFVMSANEAYYWIMCNDVFWEQFKASIGSSGKNAQLASFIDTLQEMRGAYQKRLNKPV